MSKHAQFLVGLTGGIGCGKTTIADQFAARGAAVIDTDQIAHQLTAANGAAMPRIGEQFGPAFITAEGALDRAKMREHVFTDTNAKKRLESILHPMIKSETMRAVLLAQGTDADYVILVVPLLVESGTWKQQVARLLVIDCPEEIQIKRVMSRNGLSEPQVRAIMAAQAKREERLAAADDVIENVSPITTILPQIDRLHSTYTTLANQK